MNEFALALVVDYYVNGQLYAGLWYHPLDVGYRGRFMEPGIQRPCRRHFCGFFCSCFFLRRFLLSLSGWLHGAVDCRRLPRHFPLSVVYISVVLGQFLCQPGPALANWRPCPQWCIAKNIGGYTPETRGIPPPQNYRVWGSVGSSQFGVQGRALAANAF